MDKDKIIKKLRAELKNKTEGMEVLQNLYNGCEQEIKELQEEKESLKIRVKDFSEYVHLDEKRHEDGETNKEVNEETDDEESENWKTIPKRPKEAKTGKNSKHCETVIESPKR